MSKLTRNKLVKAYASGRRDFHGVDLSNTDLSHLDLKKIRGLEK